jgi:hypothetical protein
LAVKCQPEAAGDFAQFGAIAKCLDTVVAVQVALEAAEVECEPVK